MPDIKADELYSALQLNTQAWVRTDARVEALDRRVTSLEESLDQRLGSVVAHLENVSRSTARTAELWQMERDDRLAREVAAHDAAQDRRAIARKVASEVWSIFKQPLGLLIAAALAWMAWSYFGVPPTPTPVDVQVVDQLPVAGP